MKISEDIPRNSKRVAYPVFNTLLTICMPNEFRLTSTEPPIRNPTPSIPNTTAGIVRQRAVP